MFMEVMLSLVIFSIFMLIIWRLNSTKRPHRNKAAYTANYRQNGSRKNQTKVRSLSDDFTEQTAVTFSVDDLEPSDEFTTLALTNSDTNNIKQQEIIARICKNFRKPHPLLLPLTQKAFEPNELFDLIKADPQITAKILNRVNSSAFALAQPITSINHAIIYLGVGTVKNIAMYFAIENDTDFDNQQQNKAYQKLWSASFLASSLGLLFAKELFLEDASDISTRCLLNYLGDMAILSAYSDMATSYNEQQPLYQRVNHHQCHLSINTQIIGSELARFWQLPISLTHSIDHSLSLLVLDNSFNEVNQEEQLKYIICYIACRVADLAVIAEQTCIETIRYDLSQQLDFYHLFKNYQTPKVKQLLRLFHDVNFSKKVNSLLLIK